MTIKELEAKIQKIFNNDNLRVKGNHGVLSDGVIIYLQNKNDDIFILSFEIENQKIKIDDRHHLKFYACDDIESLNIAKQALEVCILYKNEYIQKAVIEALIKEYMELK